MIKKNKTEIVVVLDNIRSMHNIGAIFRTCDALGSCSIILCGICAQPPNKDIHKTALGSTKSVNWSYYKQTIDAINYLKNKKFDIISVEQTNNSISLDTFKNKATKIALVFGNEVNGISSEIIKESTKSIEINQFGIKKSMNVSVVAGITIWTILNRV
tara:strand:- start:22 stop:495 length:474 start_codon:yes stop_codon:yes gene_type:complete